MAEAFTKAAMQKSRGGEETRTKKGGLETLKPYPTMNRGDFRKRVDFETGMCGKEILQEKGGKTL
jgi:hypothetical protein